MTESSRRVYLGLGRAFVALGGSVALASLVDRIAGLGFFQGSPVGTAALLVVVGAALLWTVAQADREGAADEPGAADELGAADEPGGADEPEGGGGPPVDGQDVRP